MRRLIKNEPIDASTRRSAGRVHSVLRHDGIELDAGCGVVTRDGRPVELTGRELRILTYLMRHPARTVPPDELAQHVYAVDQPRRSNTIEVYVARLRKKLGHDAIGTIRGLGYRIGALQHAAD